MYEKELDQLILYGLVGTVWLIYFTGGFELAAIFCLIILMIEGWKRSE